MARMPQDTDYGPRQSLAVRRTDRPGTGGVILADALNTAATTFSAVLTERKAKEDALNYALVRNKLQQADLESRAEREGDKDWANFDKKYSASLKKRSDEILSQHPLSENDMAIISSELGLIGARGRVAMGEAARIVEIDEGIGSYESGKLEARQSLASALDGPSRNAIVIGQLDAINGLVEKGYLDEESAQKEREIVTQDFAMASLSLLSQPDLITVLSASLKHRKEHQGALTADDIREGKGTNSIADFLPYDVAAIMLEKAERINKEDTTRSEAQAVMDEAVEMFPGGDQASFDQRMKHIKEKLDGDARKMAETDTRQLRNDAVAAESARATELYDDYSLQILTGDLRFSQIDTKKLDEMSSGQIQELRRLSDDSARGERWPRVTQDYANRDNDGNLVDDGTFSMEQWQDLPNYADESQGPYHEDSKANLNLQSAKVHNAFNEKDFNSIEAEQALIQKQQNSIVTAGTLDAKAMVNRYLSENLIMQTDKRTPAQRGSAARFERMLLDEFTRMEVEKLPDGKLSQTEKDQGMARVLGSMAFTDTGTFPWSDNYEDKVHFALMTPEQIEEGFIDFNNEKYSGKYPIGGQELSLEQVVLQMGKDMVPAYTKDMIGKNNLERAAFALVNDLGNEEVRRRLRGE